MLAIDHCFLTVIGRAALGWTLLIAAANSAAAEPRLALEVSGDCPSTAQMAAALAGLVIVTNSGARDAWALSVRHDETLTYVDITAPNSSAGRSTRVIPSIDCEAIAQAVRLMVRARLLYLDAPEQRPVAMRRAPEIQRRTREAIRASCPPKKPRQVSFGFTMGPRFSANPYNFNGVFRADAMIRLLSPVLLGVSISSSVPYKQTRRVDLNFDGTTDFFPSTTLWQWNGTALMGVSWETTRVRFRPSAELGFAVFRVDPNGEFESNPILRWQLLVGLNLTFAIRVARALWLRADLDAHLLPLTDRYVTSSSQEVAQSPAFQSSIRTGFEVDVF